MHIFNLPDDIFPDYKKEPEELIFHDYSAPVGSFKGKSILHSNAISLVLSGEKTMQFAETTVHVKADEFHFLSAGNCLVSMKLSEKMTFRSIVIFFDYQVLSNFYLKYDTRISEARSSKISMLAPSPYLAFRKDPFIRNFIDSLSLLISSNDRLSREIRLVKFEELMLYLLEKYPSRILSFQADKNRRPDDLVIRKAVETNIITNVSLEELAFLCNMSLSTFKRRFIDLYGQSPNEWFLSQRMKLAKEFLRQEKPGEVYHKVGYESHSSFSQAFKKTFGTTPREFQSKYLNDQLQDLNG
jgi:AraC-like DNA-binding protein